jgi:hypothetical protein
VLGDHHPLDLVRPFVELGGPSQPSQMVLTDADLCRRSRSNVLHCDAPCRRVLTRSRDESRDGRGSAPSEQVC